VPVLKAHDERQGQARLDHFLTFSQRFAKIKSKRLQVWRCVRVCRGWLAASNPEIHVIGRVHNNSAAPAAACAHIASMRCH
jgi:hypothetical protein